MDNYIEGRWTEGEGGPMSSICPATGTVAWRGHSASPSQVSRACKDARRASNEWRRCPISERTKIISAYKVALQGRSDELARTISLEVGKPLWEARTEVASMIGKVDISLKAYHDRTGEHETVLTDGKSFLTHRPHGVMAVLGPYNFPGHLPNGHIVPALIAGNCIVFKPSEYAPATATLMARCWEDAGLPPGVFNLVQGGRPVGEALTAQEEVDGLLFTGSYSAGTAIARRWSIHPEKILALEMGGNNPLVVWNVHDIDAAVVAIVQSSFVSAGQRCTCARRLIISDDEEGRAVVARLLEVTRALRVGTWNDDPPPFMGPVVSAHVATTLLDAQSTLCRLGARPLIAMRSLREGTALLSPGILDVTGVANIPDEEIFGPLLQVTRAATFHGAIAAANDTRYGLAAGLLSDDESLWMRFCSEARAGVVNWNRPTTGASSAAPFGGIGRSGNHRPSALYAADYCAYPVAGMTAPHLRLPTTPVPGLTLD